MSRLLYPLILVMALVPVVTDAQLQSATQEPIPSVGEANAPVTFTTKDGRKYENVHVSMTDTGLSVLTSDGGANVPLNNLPDDLSTFPKAIQDQITVKRRDQGTQSQPTTANSNDLTSFQEKVLKEKEARQALVQTSSFTATTGVDNPVQSHPDATATETYPPLTKVESDITSNFSIEGKRQYSIPKGDSSTYLSASYVPSISDDYPETAIKDGHTVGETIQFINSRLKTYGLGMFYDGKLKLFVLARVFFSQEGRIRVSKFQNVDFNPADFNPEKIEIVTRPEGGKELIAYTTNNAQKVIAHNIDGEQRDARTISMPVEDDPDAQSLSNAFVHLITLYGGKPEAF